MLRRFLYLNEQAVDSYLGVVEGGLSDDVTRRSTRHGGRGGEAGLGFKSTSAKVSGQRDHTEEDERLVRDTPEQRFDRLIKAVEAKPDEYDYEEVLDLADAFERLIVGTLITVACDVEVPGVVRVLSQPEELGKFLDTMETMRGMAGLLGKNPGDLPTREQTDMIRQVSRVIRSDVVVVGEVDEESPKVAGKLEERYIREMPDGTAQVVGKVARRWGTNEHYPLMALPGASLMSRSQRRDQPAPSSDDTNVLRGPALTLDIVAIYR
ncbi:MAG: hypothetical protein DLM54_00265 [Acidimicrobiales bacterium]|nr:MAG: hypothetical protein DLM54_00265 [Acidimicrobiales bacterium]